MDRNLNHTEARELAMENDLLLDQIAEEEQLADRLEEMEEALNKVWDGTDFIIDFREANHTLIKLRTEMKQLLQANQKQNPEAVDEFTEGALRQSIAELTHKLHIMTSDQIETWYDGIQNTKKENPSISSLKICSAIIEHALQEIINNDLKLKDAKILSDFLQSTEGFDKVVQKAVDITNDKQRLKDAIWASKERILS